MFDALSAQRLNPTITSAPNGDLLLTITVGKDKLTRTIPSMDTVEQAQIYIDRIVVDMAKELYRTRRNRSKRMRRSA